MYPDRCLIVTITQGTSDTPPIVSTQEIPTPLVKYQTFQMDGQTWSVSYSYLPSEV